MGQCHRKKVLLIESDLDLREQFREVLEDEGYDAICATSHGDALDYLRTKHLPSVILFDCAPPYTSGHDFLEEVKRINHGTERIPVLFLFSDTRTHLRYADSEVSEFLSKPLDLDHFVDTVERWAAKGEKAA